MKRLFIFLIIFSSLNVQGQSDSAITIDNDICKFRILRTSVQYNDVNDIVPSKYLVRAIIGNQLKIQIKEFSSGQWLNLLSNDKTDWMANLLLYELYEKDAARFVRIKNRDAWVLEYKDSDIKYWNDYFSKTKTEGH